MRLTLVKTSGEFVPRVFDLSRGLPNLHGLRIKDITLDKDDAQAILKHPEGYAWLTHILQTRFIP